MEFIPARTIGHEYFRYEEAMHAMVGNRSGETHRLGDRVTVKLVEAAPVAGALRFELLSEGRVMTGAQRRPSNVPAGPTGTSPREETVSRQEAVSWKAPMTETELMQRFSSDAQPGHANVAPRDASTLILLDRSGPSPKVLMGKRHHGHVFMPESSCSGRPRRSVRPADAGWGATRSRAEAKLMLHTRRPSTAKARGLALAAIRETFEETGLLLGSRRADAPAAPEGAWAAFAMPISSRPLHRAFHRPRHHPPRALAAL